MKISLTRLLLAVAANEPCAVMPTPRSGPVVGTGAVPVRPPITGLAGPGTLGPGDGVHLLHSMGDTFALMATLEGTAPASAFA